MAAVELLQRLLQPFVESYLSLAELIVESPSFAQAREKKVILEEALEICNTRYYFGSNQRIESANKSTLENVLKFFQNEGILSLSQGQGAKRTFHYKLENRARLLEIKTFLEKVNFHLGSLKDI